jgi:hypothetical protein
MSFAQSSTALRTGELYAGLEMLNNNCTLGKVNISHRYMQGLADAASQTKQKPDQQTVSDTGGRFLQARYLLRF